jgi:hypothetical protein
MSTDTDDLTPDQRGDTPGPDVVRVRERKMSNPLGRVLRVRSWLTIALAVIAVGLCIYLLRLAR